MHGVNINCFLMEKKVWKEGKLFYKVSKFNENHEQGKMLHAWAEEDFAQLSKYCPTVT